MKAKLLRNVLLELYGHFEMYDVAVALDDGLITPAEAQQLSELIPMPAKPLPVVVHGSVVDAEKAYLERQERGRVSWALRDHRIPKACGVSESEAKANLDRFAHRRATLVVKRGTDYVALAM